VIYIHRNQESITKNLCKYGIQLHICKDFYNYLNSLVLLHQHFFYKKSEPFPIRFSLLVQVFSLELNGKDERRPFS